MRIFKRVNYHATFGGVCGGIAYWLGLPTWIVRLATFVLCFGYGLSLWPYLLLWMFAPQWEDDPADYAEVTSS